MMRADGDYECEICGRVISAEDAKHTFLPAQDLGNVYRLPAITLDFCSRSHAQYYWKGSRFYPGFFDALSIRLNLTGVWYVTR